MFPAAAPSNAVVFAGGYLTLKDMVNKAVERVFQTYLIKGAFRLDENWNSA
jgi:hypothetical protein